MKTLLPAYGRRYASLAKAREAVASGADFILADVTSRWHGKPLSVRDLAVGEVFRLRYGGETGIAKVAISRVKFPNEIVALTSGEALDEALL